MALIDVISSGVIKPAGDGTANSTPVPVTFSGGSGIIGTVDIDQTTPGTTNGVVVNSSVLPTGAATSALQSNVQAAAGANSSSVLGVQGVTGGKVIAVAAVGTPSTTMTTTQVAMTSSGTSILALNTGRLGATVVNGGSATVFIGNTSAVTVSTGMGVLPGGAYNIDDPLYTGAIFGVVSSGGTATVYTTELTA